MAKKTVLTQLLKKWGIMSVDMQNAYESDQAVIIDDKKIYIDNPNNDNNFIKNDEFVPENDTFIPEIKIPPINKKSTVKLKNETIKDNVESLLGIGNTQYTVPIEKQYTVSNNNFNFEEQQDIIDNLDLD